MLPAGWRSSSRSRDRKRSGTVWNVFDLPRKVGIPIQHNPADASESPGSDIHFSIAGNFGDVSKTVNFRERLEGNLGLWNRSSSPRSTGYFLLGTDFLKDAAMNCQICNRPMTLIRGIGERGQQWICSHTDCPSRFQDRVCPICNTPPSSVQVLGIGVRQFECSNGHAYS